MTQNDAYIRSLESIYWVDAFKLSYIEKRLNLKIHI